MKKEKNYTLLFYIKTLKLQQIVKTWEEAAKVYYDITKEQIPASRLSNQCRDVLVDQVDPFQFADYLKLTTKYMVQEEVKEEEPASKTNDAIFKTLSIRDNDWESVFNIDLENDSNEEIIHKVREKIQDEQFLIEYLGLNPGEYEIVKFDLGAWSSTLKVTDNNGKMQPKKVLNDKFIVQLKKRTKTIPFYTREECETFLEDFLSKRYITALDVFENAQKNTKEVLDDDKIMVCPGIELHLGKLGSVVDYEDYSTKQAMWRLRLVAKEILEYQKAMKCSSLLLGIGNDYFNSDTVDDKTTAATPQNNDTRHKEVYLWGKIGYLRLIESLKTEFKKIILRNNPGNHDEKTSFNLYTNLCDIYDQTGDPKVETDSTFEGLRNVTYYVFGKNLMVFCHGKFSDSGNLSDSKIAQSIKHLFPKEFHEAYHINVFVGHLHQDRETKFDNVNIFRTASLTGVDPYHVDNLFLGHRQGHSVYVFDKDTGYVGKHNITISSADKQKKISSISRGAKSNIKKEMQRALNLSNPEINIELQQDKIDRIDDELSIFDDKLQELVTLCSSENLNYNELREQLISIIGWNDDIDNLEEQKAKALTLINDYHKKTQ